jgi:cell division protein FtsB
MKKELKAQVYDILVQQEQLKQHIRELEQEKIEIINKIQKLEKGEENEKPD